jgi:hypothetical protein
MGHTTKLTCSEPVVVYRASPGDPMGHACEPRITRLRNGELLLTHRAGSARMSDDGLIQLLVSLDDGRTWKARGRPFSKIVDGRTGDHLLAAIGSTPTGKTIAMVCWNDRSDPTKPWRNRETEGRLPLKMLCASSDDAGVTWTPLNEIDVSPYKQPDPQVICTLSSGEIVATFETFKEYDETGPWNYEAGLVISDDDGASWLPAQIAAQVDVDGTMWWDPRIAELTDGRLVQFYHAIHYPSGKDRPIHVAWSADGGRVWTYPTSTGLEGQHCWPIPLADGRLLAAVQQRHDPQGIVLYLSEDGGQSFDLTSETWVYRHHGFSAGAADGSSSTSEYFDDMDAFTFGQPTGVAFPDGNALVCYFAGGRHRTAIYAVHVDLGIRPA